MIEVRTKKDGSKGVFTTEVIEPQDTIHILKGEVSSIRTRESVEIGENEHITDELFQFCNHSFDNDNAIIVGREVKALFTIWENQEITFDYTLNESEISNPFKDKETGRMVE